jgi:hypothetical protein
MSMQACARPGEFLIHRTEAGDTLGQLSADYLGDAAQWPLLRKLNGISNPRQIPTGLSLRVPIDALRAQSVKARVIRVEGSASVVRKGSAGMMPLSRDDLLSEGDALRLGPGSFAAIALTDGSIVHIQSDTVLRMNSLRKIAATGASRSILRLDRGNVEAIVHPVLRSGRFDISTPVAVAGVRGTRFGVAVREDGETKLDVLGGAVAFQDIGRGAGANHETRVTDGMGAVVDGSGVSSLSRALVAAPDLSGVPPQFERPIVNLAIPGISSSTPVRVQVARDQGMHEVLESRLTNGSSIEIRGLSDGAYFLGVQAADEQGMMSRQSVMPFRLWARPQPPVPMLPAAGATVARSGTLLECADVEGATVYDFELSQTQTFERLVAQSIGATSCRWQLPSLPEGRYFWRATTVVRNALGEMVRGPRGDVRDFVVDEQRVSNAFVTTSSR